MSKEWVKLVYEGQPSFAERPHIILDGVKESDGVTHIVSASFETENVAKVMADLQRVWRKGGPTTFEYINSEGFAVEVQIIGARPIYHKGKELLQFYADIGEPEYPKLLP